MKDVSTGQLAKLRSRTNKLALCALLRRTDGVAHGFTTHDQPIRFAGATYKPRSFRATAVQSNVDMGVGNADLAGVLDDDGLDPELLRLGFYDGATLEVFWLFWDAPELGKIKAMRFRFGDVQQDDEIEFKVGLHSLTDQLQQGIVSMTSTTCRYEFGSINDGELHACNFDVATVTTASRVAAADDSAGGTVTDYGIEDGGDHLYWGGKLTFTSGPNEGISREIRSHSGLVFTLFTPFPYGVTTGDVFTVREGCNRTITRCCSLGNAINFGGEPDIPGADSVIYYPDAK